MPARTSMLIENKVLKLSDKNPYQHLHMPIDIFFNSLAYDQQHNAIGVILSGTGSDGTQGIKTIKELGGLVIIQDPESAKFDGMPNSAKRTGLVDLVLPPKEIGECLKRFILRPAGKDIFDFKSDSNQAETKLEEIFALLKNQSNINFSQYKSSMVARRIERRLTITDQTSLDDYLRLLVESTKETQTLCKELLINVTRFFRDPEAFIHLEKNIIPYVVEKAIAKDEDVRVWVAACSTGEEAYSLAILIDEEIKRKNYRCKVKVFAADIDSDAIAVASAGVYPKEIAADCTRDRLEKYFNLRENCYEISQHIRQMVIFAAHNMIDDSPFSNLSFVSCRNVLIYFQHAAQKKVLSSLYFALQRDGYLFLGGSESLGEIKTQYATEHEKFKIYKKTTNLRIPLGSAPPIRDLLPIGRQGVSSMSSITSILHSNRASIKNPLSPVMDRLIKDYAPDSIILNDMYDALHVYGNVSHFTKGVTEGRISNNIKNIIIDDLSVAVSTALYRCNKNEADVFYKDVVVKTSTSTEMIIDLSLLYVKENDLASTPMFFVLQFISKSDETEIPAKRISYDADAQSRQRIEDLEQELIKKQEHLQVTIEELETTNEELQSTNEELMSTNEEMQSTNEELQSVNEELYTVNSEYQEKIAQLTEANSDLDGVINATDIGIIFLDNNLCIRKFTPSSSNFINLLDSDIARPFHHISHQLHYNDLLNDVSKVSKNGIVIEKEITSDKRQTLFIRISPYKQDQRAEVSGILITITNLTRQRFVEDALENAQEEIRRSYLDRDNQQLPMAKRVNKTKHISVLVLDDHEADRVHIKRVLGSIPNRKFDIHIASNIAEAIEHTSSAKEIDLCLCDYNLQNATAKDFHIELTHKNINIPMIVLSGFSEEGLDADFLNGDIYDFLNKDELSSQLLERSIDYVLEKNKLHKTIAS